MSVVIACGIEVAVDWNSTLFEINVLRGRVSERGTSCVHILAGASGGAMQTRNVEALAHLSEGVFADEQVVLVRFVDPAANVLFEQVEPHYAAEFERERGSSFRDYYDRQFSRDLRGVMHDPVGQRDRMARSRYRDFPQRWNDAVNAVLARFVVPPPAKKERGLVLYQQAARTEERERQNRERDAAITWAFGPVFEPPGANVGAVLVAFDMGKTNESIRNKYLKGLGMVLFFVGLILFQNITSRQDKLRLLELERRYREAKAAIREALPGGVRAGELSAFGALDQAEGTVDGQVFVLSSHEDAIDALVVDPDGAGIEAAAIALQARKVFLERRGDGAAKDVALEIEALGHAALQIPLSRPLGVMLVHVEASGAVSAVTGPIGGLCVFGSHSPKPLTVSGESAAPAGLLGPLRRFETRLGRGDRLVIASGGIVADDPHARLDVDALTRFIARAAGAGVANEGIVADATSWARGRTPSLARMDIGVLVVVRG